MIKQLDLRTTQISNAIGIPSDGRVLSPIHLELEQVTDLSAKLDGMLNGDLPYTEMNNYVASIQGKYGSELQGLLQGIGAGVSNKLNQAVAPMRTFYRKFTSAPASPGAATHPGDKLESAISEIKSRLQNLEIGGRGAALGNIFNQAFNVSFSSPTVSSTP